jgi:SsrA-binding protein
MKSKTKVQITNRKAKFNYFLEKDLIAGIELVGSEVKSIRDGKVNMEDAFCAFDNSELWLRNVHITSPGNAYSHEPTRPRKLLLKRKELDKLEKELIKGYTIVPYQIFSNDDNRLKVQIFLAKGKKQYDKRDTIKERDIQREMDREKS